MNTFKLSSGLLIGESSEIDAVFLPVNLEQEGHHNDSFVDPSSGWNNTPDADRVVRGGGGIHRPLHLSRDHHQLKMDTEVYISLAGRAKEEEEEDEETSAPSAVLMHAITTDKPDSNDWCYRATLTSFAVIVIIVCILVFGHDYIRSALLWLEKLDPLLSVSVLQGLFVIISFPMAWGLSLLMVTSGYLYGWMYGPLIVTLCVSVGLAISMPVMRCLCYSQFRSRFYSRKVDAIINVVSGSHGMKVVALTRLTPIPFGLQNALFSLSSISLLRYLISSVGGLVPMTVLNCYMGSTLRTMQDLMTDDSNRMTGILIFGGQILLTILLLWFVVRKARVELKKAMDESDKSSTALPNGDCSKTVYVDHDGL